MRFIKDKNKIRYIPIEELDNHFLHREERKVMNDATLKIQTITFEVPQKYIGQRVRIRYYPGDLTSAYIFDENEMKKIYPLKRVDNSKVKRRNTSIDFSKMKGGNVNV